MSVNMLKDPYTCCICSFCTSFFWFSAVFVYFFSQALGASLSGSDCCYMVVFQYGSIVFFNVRDHEIEGYLKIVEKHASGLLPDMRKDGKLGYYSFRCYFFNM